MRILYTTRKKWAKAETSAIVVLSSCRLWSRQLSIVDKKMARVITDSQVGAHIIQENHQL
jgi:hypothetical protein